VKIKPENPLLIVPFSTKISIMVRIARLLPQVNNKNKMHCNYACQIKKELNYLGIIRCKMNDLQKNLSKNAIVRSVRVSYNITHNGAPDLPTSH